MPPAKLKVFTYTWGTLKMKGNSLSEMTVDRAKLVRQTEKACLFLLEHIRAEEWFPKSQLLVVPVDIREFGKLTFKGWIGEEKNLPLRFIDAGKIENKQAKKTEELEVDYVPLQLDEPEEEDAAVKRFKLLELD